MWGCGLEETWKDLPGRGRHSAMGECGVGELKGMEAKLREKRGSVVTGIAVILIVAAFAAFFVRGILRTKENEVVSNCRFVVMAAQAVSTEYFAYGDGSVNRTWTISGGQTRSPMKDIAELSGIRSEKLKGISVKVTVRDFEVTEVSYRDGIFLCSYDSRTGTYTVKKSFGRS